MQALTARASTAPAFPNEKLSSMKLLNMQGWQAAYPVSIVARRVDLRALGPAKDRTERTYVDGL